MPRKEGVTLSLQYSVYLGDERNGSPAHHHLFFTGLSAQTMWLAWLGLARELARGHYDFPLVVADLHARPPSRPRAALQPAPLDVVADSRSGGEGRSGERTVSVRQTIPLSLPSVIAKPAADTPRPRRPGEGPPIECVGGSMSAGTAVASIWCVTEHSALIAG